MNLKQAEYRYFNDKVFKTLVDLMVGHIEQMNYTPTEIREAAMLAQMKFEAMHPQLVFSRMKQTYQEHLEWMRKCWPTIQEPPPGS